MLNNLNKRLTTDLLSMEGSQKSLSTLMLSPTRQSRLQNAVSFNVTPSRRPSQHEQHTIYETYQKLATIKDKMLKTLPPIQEGNTAKSYKALQKHSDPVSPVSPQRKVKLQELKVGDDKLAQRGVRQHVKGELERNQMIGTCLQFFDQNKLYLKSAVEQQVKAGTTTKK